MVNLPVWDKLYFYTNKIVKKNLTVLQLLKVVELPRRSQQLVRIWPKKKAELE